MFLAFSYISGLKPSGPSPVPNNFLTPDPYPSAVSSGMNLCHSQGLNIPSPTLLLRKAFLVIAFKNPFTLYTFSWHGQLWNFKLAL